MDGVAYYDPSVYTALPNSSKLFPDSKFGKVDEALEVNYGQLLDDVIHTLCVKPMSHSQLTQSLASQFPGCLLRKSPPYPPVPGQHNQELNTVEAGSSTTAPCGSSENIAPVTASWKDRVERPLIRILADVATTTRNGNQKLFTIKPEVAVNRFNQFYFRYQPFEHTLVREE